MKVIEACNTQPYSHIHQPGIGVGGHCIPVYPRFLLAREPALDLVATSRRINDGQIDLAIDAIRQRLGSLEGVKVLVLGLTYRHGVKELAYSRALPLVAGLREAGATVLAHDPLLSPDEVQRADAEPWRWGDAEAATAVRAIITQTGDPRWSGLDWSWFPRLEIVFDGRNSLRPESMPVTVDYIGVGARRTVGGFADEAG